MSRPALTGLALGAALALGLGAVLLARSPHTALAEAPTAVVAERAYSPRVIATGSVRLVAGARVQVGSQVSGVVRRLAVRQGSAVHQGDLIAQLDDAEARARLADATARVDQATSDSAQGAAEYARVEALTASGGASDEELLAARTAALRTAAALASARAQQGLAAVALDHTRVRAPIAGVIASITTHEGETVASSLAAPTFVTIVDPARIECVALVDETDIGRVAVGQHASFTVDAYPDREFPGVVTGIAADATIISGVVDYEVTVRITGERAGLRPQMTANVSLQGPERRALVVPSAAVRQAAAGLYVWLVKAGRPAQRSIVASTRQLDVTEVTGGLAAGDTVLVGGFPDAPSATDEP